MARQTAGDGMAAGCGRRAGGGRWAAAGRPPAAAAAQWAAEASSERERAAGGELAASGGRWAGLPPGGRRRTTAAGGWLKPVSGEDLCAAGGKWMAAERWATDGHGHPQAALPPLPAPDPPDLPWLPVRSSPTTCRTRASRRLLMPFQCARTPRAPLAQARHQRHHAACRAGRTRAPSARAGNLPEAVGTPMCGIARDLEQGAAPVSGRPPSARRLLPASRLRIRSPLATPRRPPAVRPAAQHDPPREVSSPTCRVFFSRSLSKRSASFSRRTRSLRSRSLRSSKERLCEWPKTAGPAGSTACSGVWAQCLVLPKAAAVCLHAMSKSRNVTRTLLNKYSPREAAEAATTSSYDGHMLAQSMEPRTSPMLEECSCSGLGQVSPKVVRCQQGWPNWVQS